jgi:hypothetical protein
MDPIEEEDVQMSQRHSQMPSSGNGDGGFETEMRRIGYNEDR